MGEQNAVGRLSLLPEGDTQLLDGRYQLIGEIASGGMASVFLARRAGVGGFQRLVAIKRLHPHLAHEQEFIDMFLDEARIAASIHHRNVVPILEIGASDTGYYLVMEYIEGVTLAKLMTHAAVVGDPLPQPVLLRTVVDGLGGLDAAHDLSDDTGEPLNVVHRDCSPQNLLIGLDGSTRITDFGIARARSRLHTTREGAMKGKLAYMAPEQTQGDEFDRRADIFSVGVMLWEMLSQRRLFKGKTEAQTLKRLLNDTVPSVCKYAPETPKALDEVCLKALSRNPADRYATAADMADAIEAAARSTIGVATHRTIEALMKDRYGADADEQRDAVRTWLQATPTTVGPRGATTDHGWGGRERSAVEARPVPQSGKQLPTTRREGSDRPDPSPSTQRDGSGLPPPTSLRRNVATRRDGSGAPPASGDLSASAPASIPLPSTVRESDAAPSSVKGAPSSRNGALSSSKAPVPTPPAGTGAVPLTTRSWPPERDEAPKKISRPPPASTLVSAGESAKTRGPSPVEAPTELVAGGTFADESNDDTHIYESSSMVGVATDRPPAAVLTTGATRPVGPEQVPARGRSRWPLIVAALFAIVTAAVLVLRTAALTGGDGFSAPVEPSDEPEAAAPEGPEEASEPAPAASAAPATEPATPESSAEPEVAVPPRPRPVLPRPAPVAPTPEDPPPPEPEPGPKPSSPPPPSGSDEGNDLSNPYR